MREAKIARRIKEGGDAKGKGESLSCVEKRGTSSVINRFLQKVATRTRFNKSRFFS